jgi:hypothetical protein
VQLQAVCSHFFVVVMKAPLRLHAFTRLKALLLGEFIRRSEECGDPSLQRFLNAQTDLEFHDQTGQSVHFWPSSPDGYDHNQADVDSIRVSRCDRLTICGLAPILGPSIRESEQN